MMCHNKFKYVGLVSAIALLGISSFAQAGKIVVDDTAQTPGYGGWNLTNVDVVIYDVDGKEIIDGFDPIDGSYDPAYQTFDSFIYSENAATATSTPVAVLHGKDWPVGEPPGIKIINNDPGKINFPKPDNCIMTTSYLDGGYLDADVPASSLCSSDFQTHKRFKVNMLPDSLLRPVDLVFNVVDDAGTTTHYQMFQKINNYTGSRLAGFGVTIGTGMGDTFVPSIDVANGGVGLASLSLSASTVDTEVIWEPDDMATFSHGLFGPAEPPKFPDDGFFDSWAAGFWVAADPYPGTSDVIDSSPIIPGMDDNVLPSNYQRVPRTTGPDEQFGPWLHDEIIPYGIFFDDDGDPVTDAVLMAFWGFNPEIMTYGWMYSNNHVDTILGVPAPFQAVDSPTFSMWALDPLYAMDVIEDTLNLGLNYVISIGAVDPSWSTFTIRIVPFEYGDDPEENIGDPGYVTNPPTGSSLLKPGNDAVLSVEPAPTFDAGAPLSIMVADGNALLIPVTVVNLRTLEEETSTDVLIGGVFEMVETGVDRGLYEGLLPTSSNEADMTSNDGIMYVEPGDVLEISYQDADGDVNPDPVSTTTYVSSFYVIPVPGGGAAVINL